VRSTLLIAGAALTALMMSSCCCNSALVTRKDLYNPQVVNGPYTRMLHHGIPTVTRTTVITTSTSSEGKVVVPPQ